MVLDKIITPKRFFDVTDKKDIKVYSTFLKENRWGINGCPFMLEEPFLSIPDMIKDKLVHYFLKVKRCD